MASAWGASFARARARARGACTSQQRLRELQKVAVEGGNTFDALMEACKVCTLGQISNALYAVGGQYRRNM